MLGLGHVPVGGRIFEGTRAFVGGFGKPKGKPQLEIRHRVAGSLGL